MSTSHHRYQIGDRVQMHGYPSMHAARHRSLDSLEVTGFRGTVTGRIGSRLLTGATDDGRTWGEPASALDPDGTRCDTRISPRGCGCCPHVAGRCQPRLADPDRARQVAVELRERIDRINAGEPVERVGQLSLFGEAGRA